MGSSFLHSYIPQSVSSRLCLFVSTIFCFCFCLPSSSLFITPSLPVFILCPSTPSQAYVHLSTPQYTHVTSMLPVLTSPTCHVTCALNDLSSLLAPSPRHTPGVRACYLTWNHQPFMTCLYLRHLIKLAVHHLYLFSIVYTFLLHLTKPSVPVKYIPPYAMSFNLFH